MSLLKITEAEMDNTVSVEDSPTFYIEKNGAFRRVSLETIRNLIMGSDLPLTCRTVKNNSGAICSITDEDAIVGEDFYRVRLVYPYKSGGYSSQSTALTLSYTKDGLEHFTFDPLLEQGAIGEPTFYGGVMEVSGGYNTVTFLYAQNGDVDANPTVRIHKFIKMPSVEYVPINASASGASSIEVTYYVAGSGVPADSKLFYDMIQALTARVEALEQ